MNGVLQIGRQARPLECEIGERIDIEILFCRAVFFGQTISSQMRFFKGSNCGTFSSFVRAKWNTERLVQLLMMALI